MTEREVQALLDARLEPARAERLLAGLPPAERREAGRLLALARAAAALPRPAPAPDLAGRALARLAPLRPPRPSRWRWLLAPRLSPAAALAGAAAAALLAVAVARHPAPEPRAGGAARVTARLAYHAPGAREVRVAGDFNGWRPEASPLRRGPDGVWRAEIPLSPGRRYQYMFVVDGAWVTDPSARARADDGFGGQNAILDI